MHFTFVFFSQMATKPLTSEAIALTEKKMDMTLGMLYLVLKSHISLSFIFFFSAFFWFFFFFDLLIGFSKNGPRLWCRRNNKDV